MAYGKRGTLIANLKKEHGRAGQHWFLFYLSLVVVLDRLVDKNGEDL